jgi:trigger factor
MQHSLTVTSGLERRMEITVPVDQVSEAVTRRLQQLSRSARIKGFRPGKVPFAVIKNQYGYQAHSEAIQDLMQQSYAEAVDKQQLRPAGGPRIEPINIEPGSELKYAAVFEVMPEVKLAPLGQLSVDKPVASVAEQDVSDMLERMRKQRPVYAAVTRAAAKNDRVTLDYEGRIDGEGFAGGKGEGLTVIQGAGNILAELDAALVGMSAGESKTVEAKFPDNYGAKDVAGKAVTFSLTVTLVEEASLPELNDGFASAVGLPNGGLAELRAELQKGMERDLADAIQRKTRESLLDALYQANPVDLPKVLVDEQVQELQLQMMRRLGIEPKAGMALPAREPYEDAARKRVALGMLLGDIVRNQKFTVDRQRVEQRLSAAVAGSPDPVNLRRQYLQSREAMQQIESAAIEDQAIEWLLGQAKVTEKPGSFAELTGYSNSQENAL